MYSARHLHVPVSPGWRDVDGSSDTSAWRDVDGWTDVDGWGSTFAFWIVIQYIRCIFTYIMHDYMYVINLLHFMF